MTLLQRYIGKTVLHTIFLVLLVLIGLDALITFVAELGDIGNGDYGIWQVFIYVLLDLPLKVYSFFPMACLIGVLLGLGLLASNSELIVMRAAGLSIFRISLAVLTVTFMIVVAVSVVGEAIGPIFKHFAEQRKAYATSGGQILNTKHGVWQRDNLSFVHIGEILPGERLHNITRYQFDNAHRLLAVTHAQQATYQNKHWLLQNVQQSILDEHKIIARTFPTAILDMQLNPKLLRISQVLPQEMTLRQLSSYINYRERNGLRAAQYGLSFWQRLLQPLATCLMVLLAIPFIFGPLRNVTMGLRFVVGISVGFAFYMLNQFFGPMSLVYQIPPFWAAALPTLLITVIAIIMLKRIR